MKNLVNELNVLRVKNGEEVIVNYTLDELYDSANNTKGISEDLINRIVEESVKIASYS